MTLKPFIETKEASHAVFGAVANPSEEYADSYIRGSRDGLEKLDGPPGDLWKKPMCKLETPEALGWKVIGV